MNRAATIAGRWPTPPALSDAEIRRAWERGDLAKTIAYDAGRSEMWVRKKRRDLGLKPRSKNPGRPAADA